jgi:ubiquinone/menaquinone biosynthesis C-methylase UbiE
VTRHVRLRELLIAVEGLALLRHLYDGPDEAAARRLEEVRRVLDDDAYAGGEPTSEAEVQAAYRLWAETYDDPGNPIIALEQPVVWSLLESIPPGRALDAACGTGRHARQLVTLGHDVLGIDLTPEMVRRAAENVPEATFLEGDLRAIPADNEHFDLAVCALALAHLPELCAPLRELARVLRPSGRLIVSVMHPFQALLGWQAPFADARGERRFAREHLHTHADYLTAFRAAGISVRDCVEPALTEEQVRTKRRAFEHIPEATVAAYAGLPAVLIWDLQKGSA